MAGSVCGLPKFVSHSLTHAKERSKGDEGETHSLARQTLCPDDVAVNPSMTARYKGMYLAQPESRGSHTQSRTGATMAGIDAWSAVSGGLFHTARMIDPISGRLQGGDRSRGETSSCAPPWPGLSSFSASFCCYYWAQAHAPDPPLGGYTQQNVVPFGPIDHLFSS